MFANKAISVHHFIELLVVSLTSVVDHLPENPKSFMNGLQVGRLVSVLDDYTSEVMIDPMSLSKKYFQEGS